MQDTPESAQIHERYLAYDIVQVRVDGEWVDFSTIKTAEDAHFAAEYAKQGNYRVIKGLNHPIAERGEAIS